MKNAALFWKIIGWALPFLLVLGLAAGPWLTRQAGASAVAGAAHQQAAQVTPAPTALSSPQAAEERSSGSWFLVLLIMVCSMAGLLVLGIGAAILLVRLRERLR